MLFVFSLSQSAVYAYTSARVARLYCLRINIL